MYHIDKLEALFEKNFLGEADYKNLCRHVSNMRQKSGEGISIFLPKMRRLLWLMDKRMSEKEIVRQISEKLRNEYQMDLARFNANTIENLREVCLRVEAGLAAQML